MITRNRMKFMAPEGAEGGGGAAGVAELQPLPNMGETYRTALAKETAQEAAPSAATGPPPPAATGPAATGPASTGPAATGPAPKEKPASALDAVLDDAPATGETGPGETPTEDFLKDLPETLPREGRGAHWEKARGVIGKLGTTVSQQTKTIAELTKQVETAKATPPQSAAEVEALKKENADLRDAIVGINVEYSPDHRKKFIDGRSNLVSKAASKLNAFGGKGELIVAALEVPEGRVRSQAIKEALADLEIVDQNRVLQFVSEVEKLDDEKADVMKDPQGAWAKLQESEKARAQTAAQQAEDFKKSIFENVSKTLPSKYFILRSVDSSVPGATEHNASLQEMKDGALKLLGPEAKPEELVEAAYAKQALPKVQAFLVAARTELKAANAKIKEYEGADPGFRGGKPQAKTSEEEKLDKTPGQLYKETMASLAGGD